MKFTVHNVWGTQENVVAGSGNIKVVEGKETKTRRRLAPRNTTLGQSVNLRAKHGVLGRDVTNRHDSTAKN